MVFPIIGTMRCVLLFLPLLVGAALPRLAVAAELEVVELEPFLVRASDWGAQLPRGGLPGQAWQRRGTAGLAEALEAAQPGVALVRKAGMSNDVVLRGLGGDDIGVTLDGRKIYNACSNRMDPPLSHATAENAARVEIAAGPFSLKRSGTLGGHINIVSSEVEPGTHGFIEAGFGSYAGQNHSARASHADEAWAVRLLGSYLRSDPYETGDGEKLTELPEGAAAYLPERRGDPAYSAWHVGAEVWKEIDESISLRLNVLRREDDDVLFPGLKMDADSTETTQAGLRLRGETPGGVFERWTADLYANETDHVMSDRRRASSLKMPARGYMMLTDATARNWGATLDLEMPTERFGDWSLGAEAGQREWDSDNIIMMIKNEMLPDVLATTIGAYAQARFVSKGPWSAEAGLRLDRFDVEARGETDLLESRRGTAERYDAVEPGTFLSLRFQKSERLAFFGGAGSAARSPNPQELFIQVDKPMMNPDWLGNPRLEAPRATELTAGIEWSEEGQMARLRIFHAWLNNYIYPVAETGFQSYANIDARLYGLEMEWSRTLGQQWRLDGGLAWQRGRKDKGGRAGADRDLAEIPPLRARAALAYETAGTSLTLEARASTGQNDVDEALNEQDLGGWFTLSVYARRRLGGNWTLACAVENIFDEDYALHNAQVRNPFSDFTVVDEPGRGLKASLSYSF